MDDKLIMKNTGKGYEILTQVIFNQIINQNSVETINVQRDVTLQGIVSSHQIDVYWEFKYADIIYYTIIQCKDWNSPVKQEDLFTLNQVLQDLLHQPRGIMVTKTGYQEGALNFAKSHGIELFELREFTEEDAKGRIQTIVINIIAYIPHSNIIGIEYDTEWVSNYLKEHVIKGEFDIGLRGNTENIFTLNEKGEKIESLKSLVDKAFPEGFCELPKTRKEICFSEPTFLKTTTKLMPIIKISKILLDISVGKIELPQRIEFDDIIAFILKNVITNEERLIKDDLTLLR
jgi:hypothetical protein